MLTIEVEAKCVPFWSAVSKMQPNLTVIMQTNPNKCLLMVEWTMIDGCQLPNHAISTSMKWLYMKYNDLGECMLPRPYAGT